MSKEPLTEERIAEIRGREKAATQGPWRAKSEALEADECGNVTAAMTYVSTNDKGICILYGRGHDDTNAQEDAAFIANAREDIPALLDEVERLRAEIARQENVIWFFSEAVKDFARYEVKLGTPKEYKTEIGGEYPSANRVETWKEPYWRKAADMATRESPGESGDFPESEQGEER